MKEKIVKLVSAITILCLMINMILPYSVKSAQVVVDSMYNTFRGIGYAQVFSVNIKGYSNLYCANGGATLNNGTVFNDNGISMYDAKEASSVTTSASALSWILDNIYLTDATDSAMQNAMKNSLKNVIKTYSSVKNSNGEYILNKKLGITVNDSWINTAVDSLIKDKTTLFATQQYAIWHYVKNAGSSYNNAMQNSDGSYNAIPYASADRNYYTALYISLVGLADQAQKNGYVSPNYNSSSVNISLASAGDVKATIQSDGKTALIGPYKLKNNNSNFSKAFSATVNSQNADKIETVDKNGKTVSVSSKQDAFYVKVTYNKGFEKNTKYNFKINVKISGYRTSATLLTAVDNVSQPLITVKKEAINANSSADASYFEELKGKYSLVLEKVDSSDSNKKLQGVTFKVKEGNNEEKSYGPTDSKGLVTVFKDKNITKEGIAEYTITEVDLGNNQYIKLKDEIKIYITLSKTDNAYTASKVSLEKDKDSPSKDVTLEDGSKVKVTAVISGNTVKITIPNKIKPTGKYGLVLEKVDSENTNTKLAGVTFKVKEGNNEEKSYGPTDSKGLVTIFKDKNITKEGIAEYTITEVDLGNNQYIKLKDEIKIYITLSKTDNAYTASKVSLEKDKDSPSKDVTLEDGSKVKVTAVISGNTVKITIPNKKVIFDLALRKFITKINGQELENSREPVITEEDVSALLTNGTALYNNPKSPIKVEAGDVITYKIRIYNEGNMAGYAKEVTDYLSNNLEFLENSEVNKANGWTGSKNEDGTTIVKTSKLSDELIPASYGSIGYQKLAKGQTIEENEIFWKDIEIECKVKENVEQETKLINVAEITNYGYTYKDSYVEANKENVDRDSQEDNVFGKENKDQNSIDEYYDSQYNNKNNANNGNSENNENNNNGTTKYYPGKQDDDDFENLYVEPNLSEFKFVLNKVDEKGNPLIGADFTVKREKDSVDEVLLDNQEVKGTYEVLENQVKTNTTYTYRVVEVESAPEYVNIMEGKFITIKVYMDEQQKLVLGNYEKVEEEDTLINKYGFIINNEDGSIVKEDQTDLYQKIKVTLNNQEIPSKVEITIPNALIEKDFDLALRKFITEIKTEVEGQEEKNQEITNRIPEFKIDEDGNYVYEHTKEPIMVVNGNIVVYTLRVYNEGEVDGYAKQIKDDIPDGLEFLPSYSLNEEYRWKMLDQNGKETTEVKNAVCIVTDYLSKEQEAEEGENLIKAFDIDKYKAGEIKEPYYKEVKVAFKVNGDEKSEEIIINQAQISDDSDGEGNEVTDKDSTPNEWVEGEDDQDIEKVKLQYFDLSLRKWVTKAIVVENGNQTITETGHTAEDDPEEIVKVDLNKSKISDVTVKFVYRIRVKNEGKIAGYAKEISDYIPEGLKFVKEDNPDWEEVEGKVVTNKLENTLLQPEDTATVEIILTWINNENNMGLKVNTAEISKDFNEYGTPDIDSTPNNKVPGEDDIDDAPVMLTVKTGQVVTYVSVTMVMLVMIAGSLYLIKRFV